VSKILNHPDRDDIVAQLTNGESVRAVEKRLKDKYPKHKHLWVSSVTLQTFRKNHLNLEGRVLKDIQEEKLQIEERKKVEQIEHSDKYNEKISEIADSTLDVASKIVQLDAIIDNRMKYWYNAVANGDESASKGDKELRQFMDRQMLLLAQYKKFVEGMADKTVDYNVNITVMNDQINIIREVLHECLAVLSAEQAALFYEKLNTRLQNTPYNQSKPKPVRLEDLHEAEFELLGDGQDNG